MSASVDYADGQPKLALVAEIPVGGEPWQVAVDGCGKSAYVVLRKDQKVVKIDGIDGEQPVKGATADVGSEPTGVALTPNNSKLYVANWVDGTLSVLDPRTLAKLGTVDLNPVLVETGALGKVTPRAALAHPRALTISNNGDASDEDEAVYVTEWFSVRNAPESADGSNADTDQDGLVYKVKVGDGAASRITLPAVAKTGFKDTRGLDDGHLRRDRRFEGNTWGISGGVGALVTVNSNPPAASDRIDLADTALFPPSGAVGLSGSAIEVTHNNRVIKDWDDITAYVQSIRSPRAPRGLAAASVSAGKTLFKDLATGGRCQGCHGGAKWTVSRVFYTPGGVTNEARLASPPACQRSAGRAQRRYPRRRRYRSAGRQFSLHAFARGCYGLTAMELTTDVPLAFPRALVFATYRDNLEAIADRLPNVRGISIRERREERPGEVLMVADWRGGTDDIPAFARPFLTESMLAWTDNLLWKEPVFTTEWRIDVHAFPGAVKVAGKTNYVDAPGGSRIEFRGDLTCDLTKVPGVPHFMARSLKGTAEKILIGKITHNLAAVGAAVGQILEQRGS